MLLGLKNQIITMSIQSSELITNDDGSIFHLHLLPEDLADTVILVGDPGRVETIATYFDSVELKKSNREFYTLTGTYKNRRLSVLSTGIGPDRFDGNPALHYHFICKHCGSVLDLSVDGLDHINVLANQGFDGEIEGHITYFYGKCADCKKNS